MNNKLTIIDFFCGAGGFTEGFRQMGFKTLYGYDHWLPATQTYNHNYNLNCGTKDILSFLNSVEEILNVPDTTIILGSPPCVSFSTSNKSGKADKYLGIKLIKAFLRVVAIKKHQPNSILEGWFMENVVNSKKHLQEFYTFEDLNLGKWALEIEKLPGDIALTVKPNTVIINSADYGSHQARKRSITGEIISKGKFIIPQATNSEEGHSLPAWQTLGELLNQLPAPNLPSTSGFINDPIYPSIRIEKELLSDHFYDSGLYECEWKQSESQKTNHYCMGKMAFPENRDKPGRTVTATKSGTSREGLIYKSEYKRKGDGEYRSPTVREIASIMGFPITYQFTGNMYAKWRQVGNAVCPSVSRALAKEFLLQNNYGVPEDLILQNEVNQEGINNLNTFSEAIFTTPPKRTNGSKFRRQPVKGGNITVTLSNFDIKSKEKPNGKWITSIQYGTGKDFKHQIITDGFYKTLEEIIKSEIKAGGNFINTINNGFSDKIANSSLLQKMYEQQQCENGKREPTHLIDDLKEIINGIPLDQENYIQKDDHIIFKHKEVVLMKHLLALYGVNKIATIANEQDFV